MNFVKTAFNSSPFSDGGFIDRMREEYADEEGGKGTGTGGSAVDSSKKGGVDNQNLMTSSGFKGPSTNLTAEMMQAGNDFEAERKARAKEDQTSSSSSSSSGGGGGRYELTKLVEELVEGKGKSGARAGTDGGKRAAGECVDGSTFDGTAATASLSEGLAGVGGLASESAELEWGDGGGRIGSRGGMVPLDEVAAPIATVFKGRYGGDAGGGQEAPRVVKGGSGSEGLDEVFGKLTSWGRGKIKMLRTQYGQYGQYGMEGREAAASASYSRAEEAESLMGGDSASRGVVISSSDLLGGEEVPSFNRRDYLKGCDRMGRLNAVVIAVLVAYIILDLIF